MILLFMICICLVNAIPLPTKSQLEYSRLELGAIIHFEMGTMNGSQGCDPKIVPDISQFDPKEVDTDQWAKLMNDMGVKYTIYTGKHNCGFLTYPSKSSVKQLPQYEYQVKYAPYHEDLVSKLFKSISRYGIAPGVYYSVVINAFLNVENGVVQNSSLTPNQVNVSQSDFESLVIQQLTELYSNYGNFTEVWFDGGYTQTLQQRLSQLLAQLQPNAVAFNGFGVSQNPSRWVGTESGMAPYPLWSTGNTSDGGDPNSNFFVPAECDTTLQEEDQWFYNPSVGIRSLTELQNIYHNTVGSNCNLLLDFAPGPDGKIPDDAANVYRQFGDWIRSCYGNPIAKTNLTDGSFEVILNLPGKYTSIDRIVLSEDQSLGQRVRIFSVSYLNSDGKWVEEIKASSIGNKYIGLFTQKIVTSSLRLRIHKTAESLHPSISLFGAYLC